MSEQEREPKAETPEDQEPKIVVDEGWKSEAEAERKRLAEQETAASAEGADQAGRSAGGRGELPQASFATLVSGLVTQILFAVGAVADPNTGRRFRDLALAKHHIDTLAVLEEKTKGNLTGEEKQILDGSLYEVRMAYVRAAQGAD